MKYLESGSQTGSEWQDDLLSGRQNLGTSNHRGRETRSATYGSHSEDGHTITQVVGIDRANFKSVNQIGLQSQQSSFSHDAVTGHVTHEPFGEGDRLSIQNNDLNNTSNYGKSYDSGIQVDEVPNHILDSPVKSPRFVPEFPTRSLQDELFSAVIATHREERPFFAKDQLSKILTEDRVRRELTTHFEDSLTERTIAKYAKTICQENMTQDESLGQEKEANTRSYIKILAILIIIQKTNSIVKLLEEDVSDSDLPLIKVPRPNDVKLFDLRVRRRPNMVLKCFQKKWNQLNIRNFEEWQWTTIPLVFSQSIEHREVEHHLLEDRRILPFIKDGRKHKPHFSDRTELEGGFASVFKVTIHPQHHNFHIAQGKPEDAGFAIKGLHSQNREAFKREVEMLNKFSGNKHDHLISLLATYEQSNRFFLVFDWAEADLQGYWRRVNPSPSFDKETVLWMAKQCKGIASGITKIHEHQSTYVKLDPNRPANKNVLFGHHGDIKPENVLYFAEPGQTESNVGGTLKLSDFGLAELSIHETISMTPKSKWGVSLGYRAPESDLKQGAAIGRSYDIWTLGCLYLEFITWMLGGRALLDNFLNARKARDAMWHDIETHTFFKLEIDSATGEKKAIIKPAVTQFINQLQTHPKCSQLFHDILRMVEDDLLVIKQNDKRQIDRISIQQVHQRLAGMVKDCESDEDYAIKPLPRSPVSQRT